MDNSAYVPNHLPPPSLVVFSQAGGLPEALRMQRPFNPQVSVLLSLPYIRLSLCLLLHLSVSRNLAKIIKLHPSRLLLSSSIAIFRNQNFLLEYFWMLFSPVFGQEERNVTEWNSELFRKLNRRQLYRELKKEKKNLKSRNFNIKAWRVKWKLKCNLYTFNNLSRIHLPAGLLYHSE